MQAFGQLDVVECPITKNLRTLAFLAGSACRGQWLNYGAQQNGLVRGTAHRDYSVVLVVGRCEWEVKIENDMAQLDAVLAGYRRFQYHELVEHDIAERSGLRESQVHRFSRARRR